MGDRKTTLTVMVDADLAEYAEQLVESGSAGSVSAAVSDALASLSGLIWT
jgi:hypothetical protein